MLYIVLVVFVIASRFMPHAPNIAPVAAFALFAGATAFQAKSSLGKTLATVAPFAALLISDIVIGTYTWQVMAAVYSSYGLSIVLGRWIGTKYSFRQIVLFSLAGSIIFYLTTNAAVWAFTPMYSKTLAGLIHSYTLALPFFRNTLIGDLLYTGIIFGAYELANRNTSFFAIPFLRGLQTARVGRI